MNEPTFLLAWEASVDVGPRQALGESPIGQRFLIPILGGTFVGPRIRGTVLAGGSDRQLWRRDGVRLLDAHYEMLTDDGDVITVRNRVTIDDPEGPDRYAWSQVQLIAPDGPHAWLNRRVFIGTLKSLLPGRQAVVIRIYQVA